MKVRIKHGAAEHDEPGRYAIDLEVENDATLIVGEPRYVVEIREIRQLIENRNALLDTVRKARRLIPGFEGFEKSGVWVTEQTSDDVKTCCQKAQAAAQHPSEAIRWLIGAVRELNHRDEDRRMRVLAILKTFEHPAAYQTELIQALRSAVEAAVS